MSDPVTQYLQIIIEAWDHAKKRQVPLVLSDEFINLIREALKAQ